MHHGNTAQIGFVKIIDAFRAMMPQHIDEIGYDQIIYAF